MSVDFEEAVTKVYREYATDILRMCFLYLGDYQQAEDAMQETFVRVFRHFGKFHGNSEIKTWINRIAINVCKDLLVENKVKRAMPMSSEEFEAQLEESATSRKSEFGHVEDRMVLTRAIGRLEDKLREVVVLFYYQELTTKEIAQIVGVPRTTVEFRLKQARKLLKNDLKGVNFDGRLEESAGY